jgi:N-acyl-D-aspartate/D-glutamate deacylase
MYDLVLKGGRIYDGSGLPAFGADLAISDGRIAAIGRIDEPARRVIDVDGLAVSPGFIDLHTHMDAQLFWDPLATSLNEHGVTSVVTGNCGLTLMPCKPEHRDALVGTFVRVEAMPREVLETNIPWTWVSHDEYARALETRGLGVNVATFVGHCAIRQYVMGDDAAEREATDDEIAAMERLVEQGMQVGAFGFSTNRNDRHFREDGRPVPSLLASREEIDRLSHVVGRYQRGVVQFTHGGFKAADNMGWYNALALATRRPVIWQSILHRWSQPDLWRKQLQDAEDSFRQGAPAYPLTNARQFVNRWTLKNAQEFDEMPTWKTLMFLPLEVRRQQLQDPDVRRKLSWEAVEDTKIINFSRRWDLVYITKVARPENKQWEGRSVAEYAAAHDTSIIDGFLDLALSEDMDTVFETSNAQGDEDAVAQILRSPYVLVGQSDAGAHGAYDAGFGYCTQFLGHWTRDRGVMSLEEAVRKLTFMIASVLGIRDRGLLRPGLKADVTVFDPATVAHEYPEMVNDLPGGGARYVQHARGIHYTIVNGEVLMEGREHTGALPGQVLRCA